MIQGSLRHGEAVLETVNSASRAGISEVAASWCRSALRHGLDPDERGQRERIGDSALATLKAEYEVMLAVAMPVLDHMFRSVGRSGCAVILSDARGVILERRANDADMNGFSAAGLLEGARWGEAEEGTNGIGTCLFEEKPIVIHRDQHFASRNVDISCMDAPVHDPHGRLAGALDVSSCRDDHGPALLQRLAAVRGRLSLCADQAAAAKWWLSMPMASVSAEGPMPKALSTRRTSPLMPGCRHQGRACPLRRARMTSNPLIVA